MKRTRLSRTLFLLMAILGVIGILGTAYMWGTLEYYPFKSEVKQLRESHLAEQKALIITGFAMNEDVEATLEMGALGCLHKPYSAKELESIVNISLIEE